MINCAEFLRISYGRIRCICPVNALYYQFNSEEELKQFAITLAQQVNRYRLEGLILSDYRIAVLLHALLPELEIHTSCNGYQWNLRQMEIWREQCGAQVFNPPREILRTPTKLKEMHAAGFRLKSAAAKTGLRICSGPTGYCHVGRNTLTSMWTFIKLQDGIRKAITRSKRWMHTLQKITIWHLPI